MLVYDTEVPSIDISSPINNSYQTENVNITWNGRDVLSGIAYYVINIDGNFERNVSAETNSLVLNGLPDGSHMVSAKAVDKAGNFNQTSVTFIVDTILPFVVAHSPVGDEVAVDAILNVTFSEPIDQTSVVIFNGINGTYTWNGNTVTFIPASSLAYGTSYMVQVIGKDLAGNVVTYYWNFTTASGGRISGIITDTNGNPIANATITLGSGLSTITDSSGRFSFDNVTAGSYNLSVTKEGYQTTYQDVIVTQGQGDDLGSLSVQSVETGSSNPSGSNDGLLIAAGLVIIMGVGVGAILALRRGRKA